MANFVEYNANYYNNDIGDCVVRAISMGTNIGYVTICKMLHKEFKKGFGMLGSGVSLEEIDKFAKETKFISLYDQDSRYVNWLNDKSNKEELRVNFGLPLELWMENVKSGRYVVSTRKPTLDKKEAAKDIHMVYVNCNTQKYYDRFCNKYQGSKFVLTDVFKDRYGKYHNDVIYEIIFEQEGENG